MVELFTGCSVTERLPRKVLIPVLLPNLLDAPRHDVHKAPEGGAVGRDTEMLTTDAQPGPAFAHNCISHEVHV